MGTLFMCLCVYVSVPVCACVCLCVPVCACVFLCVPVFLASWPLQGTVIKPDCPSQLHPSRAGTLIFPLLSEVEFIVT